MIMFGVREGGKETSAFPIFTSASLVPILQRLMKMLTHPYNFRLNKISVKLSNQ